MALSCGVTVFGMKVPERLPFLAGTVIENRSIRCRALISKTPGAFGLFGRRPDPAEPRFGFRDEMSTTRNEICMTKQDKVNSLIEQLKNQTNQSSVQFPFKDSIIAMSPYPEIPKIKC